jgi:hypothetical protein
VLAALLLNGCVPNERLQVMPIEVKPLDIGKAIESFEDNVAHLVCHCNDDVALCGKDVTNDAWTDSETCPMCEAVDELHAGKCPRCGCEECP